MHARHRNPGNGYRSGSMGGGMGMSTSRGSPDGSVRGHGYYNSEYRSFNNRGFGRGQGHSKPYKPPQPQPQPLPPPPPPPQRGDIFMEAGRLAAEYLVSQGMLPPIALAGKWQNGSLKKQMGELQEFRAHEGDNSHISAEGRTSALSRLGNAASEGGSGRRRYSDDYKQTGSRSHARERRGGNFRSYSSDWSRENGRSPGRSTSWSDRPRISPDMEDDDDDDDTVSVHNEEQRGGKEGSGQQKSGSSELVLKSENIGNFETEVEKYQFQDDVDSKASSSSAGKDTSNETDVGLTKRSNGLSNLHEGAAVMKDSTTNNETEKQSAIEESPKQQSAVENETFGKSSSDLLAFCNFAKIPTKIRSSLTYRASKVDAALKTIEENNSDAGLKKGSEVPMDGPFDVSTGDAQSIVSRETEGLDPETSKTSLVQPSADEGALLLTYGVEQGKCMRSQSFPGSQSFQGGEFLYDQEQGSSQGPPGFGRSSSMVEERGEKRALEESNIMEAAKKPREWLPSMVTKADDYFQVSNMGEKKVISQEDVSLHSEKVTMDVDQENLINNSSFPKGDAEPCVEYAQEKQLFPNSYKICDLNLLQTSDMNENHHTDPIIIYPSTSETRKGARVDIDLSISNNNMSGEYGRHPADGKEIEVIDLENDSAQEDKAITNLDRKTEPVYTSLEGFPNHAQNAGDVPDIQDYNERLMVSEFLDAFQNPVPEDINPLQNDIGLQHEMGLHNGEGTLGDDDSIYMSLGEIPLSFLRAWEQPPQQEYEKPF